MRDYQLGDFGSSSTQSTLEQFRAKLNELTLTQKKVDEGLARMPAGPQKDRLLKMRAESRGIFATYIKPAIDKIRSVAGSAFAGEDDDQFGVIPLIPIAATMAATAALGYVGKSIYTEQKILNDPSFTAAQKTQLLSGGGLKSIADAASSIKTLAIIGVVAFFAWQFLKAKKVMGTNQ